jgi:hypothetical protein
MWELQAIGLQIGHGRIAEEGAYLGWNNRRGMGIWPASTVLPWSESQSLRGLRMEMPVELRKGRMEDYLFEVFRVMQTLKEWRERGKCGR